jgi:hypothetical protein
VVNLGWDLREISYRRLSEYEALLGPHARWLGRGICKDCRLHQALWSLSRRGDLSAMFYVGEEHVRWLVVRGQPYESFLLRSGTSIENVSLVEGLIGTGLWGVVE